MEEHVAKDLNAVSKACFVCSQPSVIPSPGDLTFLICWITHLPHECRVYIYSIYEDVVICIYEFPR